MSTTKATRREVITGIARTAALLVPGAALGGCAGSPDAVVATSALGATGATAGPVPAAAAPTRARAALLLPLSGALQFSLVGQGLRQAAELALAERNTPSLSLDVLDDKGTPEGAQTAAKAALAGGAEIILGPLLAPAVAAVAPLARAANVPVVAFSNEPANGGRGVHLLSFFDGAEVARVTSHAIAQGRRHFAALIPSGALGQDAEPAFRRAVADGGGQIALIERYPSDFHGMMGPAQRVLTAVRGSAAGGRPIDALFLPSSADGVGKLSAMLRHHGIDGGRTKLLLTSGWDTPALEREPHLAGAWLAAPDPRGWVEFSRRFGEAYKTAPPRLATLAYDAVAVAAAFASQPKGQRFTPANLMREHGFAGADGPFRLTAAGPVERSLAVLEVQPQGLVTVAVPTALGEDVPSRPPGQLSEARLGRGS